MLRITFPSDYKLSPAEVELQAGVDLLSRLMGRLGVFHLDGARYHTKTTPGYIPWGSIYCVQGRGWPDVNAGMKAGTCIDILSPPLRVPSEADEQREGNLRGIDVMELRKMVDDVLPEERLEARGLCRSYHCGFAPTPPYCGKWINATGSLWSLSEATVLSYEKDKTWRNHSLRSFDGN